MPTPTTEGETREEKIVIDWRSPLALARDDYLGTREGFCACDPTTLGAPAHRRQYLKNRIEAAWLAGAAHSADLERQLTALNAFKEGAGANSPSMNESENIKTNRQIYSEQQILAALTIADFHSGLNGITREMCDESVKRLDGAPMSAVLASAYMESQKTLRLTQGFRTGDMRTGF